MSKLTIYTNSYTNKLINWAEKNEGTIKIYNKEYNSTGYFIEVESTEPCKKSLAIFLEEIIFYKNPVTRDSKDLCNNIVNLIFLPCRKDIYIELSEFLKENNTINVEGYTNFRMDQYNHLINLVLYALVKKSL